MTDRLYYVHDPMCSWCYGFRPALKTLMSGLPQGIEVVRLLGGLAPDSDSPMAPEMRQYLQQTWHRIQHRIPGTEFNFDFWRLCVPRRSTWPACRAVIAAREQDPSFDQAMTEAIQKAYYRDARNPSLRETLVELAGEIGADAAAFEAALDAGRTREQLAAEIAQGRSLGVDSFPGLALEMNGSTAHISVDYTDADVMLKTIEKIRRDG